MKNNIQEVATQNAEIQFEELDVYKSVQYWERMETENEVLKNQVSELKQQLKEHVKTVGIYYEITKFGRYEVEDNEDFYQCMICINEGDYREEIEKLNIFAEERGQRVYIVYEKDYGWKIEYKNPNGIVVRLTPEQLFNSPRYNLLDDIDDLE